MLFSVSNTPELQQNERGKPGKQKDEQLTSDKKLNQKYHGEMDTNSVAIFKCNSMRFVDPGSAGSAGSY